MIMETSSITRTHFMENQVPWSRFRSQQHNVYGDVVTFTNDFISNFIQHDLWEGPLCKDMAEYYVPGTDFVDIGANLGLNTLLVNYYKPITGTVHLFEPQHDVFLLLKHNTRKMKRKLYNFGLSDKPEIFSYSQYTDNVGATSLVSPPTENNDSQIHVACVALDTIEFKNPVSLVKMDVEGAEIAVLNGGAEFFRKHRPALFIEMWDRCYNDIDVVLKAMGYEMVRKVGIHDYLYLPVA